MSFTAPDIAWSALSPVLVVLAAGVVGVLVEAFVPDRVRRPVQLTLTFGALVGSIVASEPSGTMPPSTAPRTFNWPMSSASWRYEARA